MACSDGAMINSLIVLNNRSGAPRLAGSVIVPDLHSTMNAKSSTIINKSFS